MKTTVVNIMDRVPFDVYVGRAGAGLSGLFGNPFDEGPRVERIRKFEAYFLRRVEDDPEFRAQVLALRGKRLACFCRPKPCHATVIASWVDAQEVP